MGCKKKSGSRVHTLNYGPRIYDCLFLLVLVFVVHCFFFLFLTANSLVCWHAYFLVFSRVLIAVGIAWQNHLAVIATRISVS